MRISSQINVVMKYMKQAHVAGPRPLGPVVYVGMLINVLKGHFPLTLWIIVDHACLYFATKSDLSLLFLQEPINIITTISVSVAQREHLKMVRTMFLI